MNIPMQRKWGGCVRATGTDWTQPSLGCNNSAMGLWYFPATQLRVSGTLSPLWSMVDVLQAWEDVAMPKKLSQQALDTFPSRDTEMGLHTLESTEPPRAAYSQQQGDVRSKQPSAHSAHCWHHSHPDIIHSLTLSQQWGWLGSSGHGSLKEIFTVTAQQLEPITAEGSWPKARHGDISGKWTRGVWAAWVIQDQASMTPEGWNEGSLEKKQLLCSNPAGSKTPSSPHSMPRGGMGKIIGKKAKPIGQDNDSLVGQKRKTTIIIMTIKEYTNQVMHKAIAYHSLSDVQSVPKQHSPPPG